MLERGNGGFSLVELAVVLVVMGLLFGIGVPSFLTYRRSQELQGAAENIASQLRLARSTAIMTGRTQRFHLYANFNGYDYHVHDGTGPIKTGWNLPDGITYEWANALVSVDMTPDGRASTALSVVLNREDGQADTVFVEKTGMILIH